MENIGKAMQAELNRSPLKERLTSIKREVLNDQAVKTFLSEHNLAGDDPIVERSLSKLYEFVQENKRSSQGQDPKFENYHPQLIMNVNYIDVKYLPNQDFIAKQVAYQEKQRVTLVALPKSLKEARFSDFDTSEPSREKALEEVLAFADHYLSEETTYRPGLYLHGPFGVGKTYLLAALANYFAKHGLTTTMVHYPQFVLTMKDAIADNSVKARIDQLMTAEILVLDDIGAENNTAWTRDELLGVILQHRMQEELPTFFSSNFSMAELEDRLAHTSKGDYEKVKASRLMQRIKYLSQEVMMSGRNRRFS
ncbi:primosomal protein DnaI [Aerococcus kribbianus]|uniref:Primosomal protein DnaI n=1 Tax=Aerococcus kribbianus TaxID=2999064 RepID=A0A9X3FVM4_9LACT|nr:MULTISPECIES: primosomal protein DnaI [unclassified Aerococcus]MCZ0717761.1 primosomal protein DnaI [Aerococcus sp. YH-aer221]MCZ0726049.1 primosomal protein DnaI [Aerococcus sp. YH-aer222]